MTVKQIEIFSDICLMLMIIFLVAAIVVFFMMDVRKAWKIVVDKRIQIPAKELASETRLTQKISTTDLLKKDMLEKNIAMQLDNATTLLVNQHGKEDYIIVDISCIHSEVVL